jgi:caffeoyl-CoA O-methyltransferase
MTNLSIRAKRPVTPNGILAQSLAEVVAEMEDGAFGRPDSHLVQKLKRLSLLAGGLEPYVDRCTSRPSPTLQSLSQRTTSHDWDASFQSGETDLYLEQEMLSGHAEGELLKLLVGISGAKSILEIGMFTGYATAAMAEAMPANGCIVALEYDAFVAAFAHQSLTEAGLDNKVDIRVGAASDSLADLMKSDSRFDFVFIDADKSGYEQYLQTLLDGGLLTDDALICVDNTLLQGEAYLVDVADSDVTENGHAIASFNDFVNSRADLHHVLLPLRDGVTLIRRRTTLR